MKQNTMPEFVGTTVLDTIGLVIASVDPELRKKMKIKENYRSVGIISSRTGAAGQITAVDDAVKETNTEVLSIMLPRDTKGWGGHGNYIVIGAETVADARRAVEIALEKTKRNAGRSMSAMPDIWNLPIPHGRIRHLVLPSTFPEEKPLDLSADLRQRSVLSWRIWR